MRIVHVFLCGIVAMGRTIIGQQPSPSPSPGSVDELVGLWKAKTHFGPDARGRQKA